MGAMSASTPDGDARVPMIETEDWDPELLSFVQRAVVTGGEPLNFFKSMAHHPKLLEKWTVFAARLLGKGILDPRDRELVVLRTVHLCGAEYEWVHHSEIAAENGLAPEEVRAITEGPDAAVWGERERALLRAADELDRDCVVSDGTYEVLTRHFDHARFLEIVMLAGNYRLVSYFVRSFGVPLEAEAAERARD